MEGKKPKSLLGKIPAFNPTQIAIQLSKQAPAIRLAAARRLSRRTFGQALLEMEEEQAREFLERIPDKEIARIVSSLKSDDATDLIHLLEKNRVRKILKLVKKEKLEEIKPLLRFEEETAGALMQSEFISVKKNNTVAEAIEKIRASKNCENLHDVFVVDRNGKIAGVVSLRKLAISKPTEKIKNIMKKEVVFSQTSEDQEQVAKKFKEYELISMPVVNSEKKMVGIITVDDVIDVIEEEATEDIYRLAGVDEEESVFSSPFVSITRRTPWLAFDLIIVMISASVIGLFENTLAAVIALAMFIPVVANIGGNAGTQTLAVMVRSLALGEIGVKEYKRALKKEIIVGLINGLIIGLLIGAIVTLWKDNIMLGIVLLLAMLTNQLTAALAGTLVPVLFKWRRIDPALASSIIITGCTDIMGFLAFLGIATIFWQAGLLA